MAVPADSGARETASASPLRLAYLVHGVDGRGSGVRAKVLEQASTWAALAPDVEVGLFVRCEAGAEDHWVGQPGVVKVRSSRAGIPGRLLQREILSVDVARWRPDVLYLRQSTVSPSVVGLALALPTVVELNTLDLAELRLRSRPRYWYARATRGFVLRAARGIVSVSHEIAAHPDVRRLGVPVATVPNGIDLSAFEPLPAPSNPVPRLVFLGAPRLPWHGLDRVAWLARRFPAWTFDVVGPDPDELRDAPSNLRFHGLLDRGEYLPILAGADVAVGSLGLHRKSMDEASPLKVAEYLAHGLPTIIGYTDTRFPDGAPFLHRLPNDDADLEPHANAIAAFVEAWRGRRVARQDVAGIHAGLIEQQRLAFIRDVAAPARASEAAVEQRVG